MSMTLINDGSAHLVQDLSYSCGRASAAIVLRIHGYKVKEKQIRLMADPDEGCPPEKLIRFFKNRKFPTKHKFPEPCVKSLEKVLDKGWPIIVAYQDWAHRPSETNYHVTWDNGHYAVMIGYDAERFWFIDPSSSKKKRSLLKEDFLGRWRDISSCGKLYHNWGLAIGPKPSK